MFYTYAHYRADDGRIFYIGKGSGRRYYKTNNRNIHWHRVVKKHGFKSEILARWGSEKEALDHEKFLISVFREIASIVNILDGGESNGGTRHTPESKEKLRIAHTGRKRSDEARRKSSEKLKGRAISEEWKQKISKSRAGIKVPITYKKVYCVTLDLSFESVTCASAILGIDKSHIVKSCRGKIRAIKGLEFKYG